MALASCEHAFDWGWGDPVRQEGTACVTIRLERREVTVAQSATASRPKSQAKTGAATRTAASAAHSPSANGAEPYFNYAHVAREARIVPNKSAIGFSVQLRESTGEYGTLGQWKNAEALPIWALRPLLQQCGFLGGGQTAPTTISQQADGAGSVDMLDKVTVGSAQ